MTFGGVVGSSGSSGRPGSSGSAGSGSGVGSSSGPGIVVVGAVVSGSGVGSSSEPGIVVSGAGSGSDSEVSNVDVVVGAVDSEDCGSEDSGAEVGVDGSAAWVGSGVGSDVGSLVAELVVELEGSAVVVSVVVFSEVVCSEADVLEVGRSEGSAGEDAAEDCSADVVLFVDSVVWEGSADWEDEEVAVGVLAAAIWGAGSELEDGVAAGVV